MLVRRTSSVTEPRLCADTVLRVQTSGRPYGVRVAEVYPALAAELVAVLTADNRPELARQVPTLVIMAWCRCGDDFCQTFKTARPPWPTEVGTLPYDTSSGMLNVDVAGERILGVEALFYPPLA
jgi:hypothetical protein